MQPRRERRKARQRAAREADTAWEALEEGNLDLALKAIQRALDDGRDSPAIWTDYGRVLAAAGRLKESEKALRNAILIAPAYAEAYVHLAETLSRMGLTIQAHKFISKAVELRPQVLLYRELEQRYREAMPER